MKPDSGTLASDVFFLCLCRSGVTKGCNSLGVGQGIICVVNLFLSLIAARTKRDRKRMDQSQTIKLVIFQITCWIFFFFASGKVSVM